MMHLEGAPSKLCLGGMMVRHGKAERLTASPKQSVAWFERTGILTMRVACASKTPAQAERGREHPRECPFLTGCQPPMTASASISTSISGDISALTCTID